MQFNSNSYLVGMVVTSHDDDEVAETVFQDYSMATADADSNPDSGALDNYEFIARRDSWGGDIRNIQGGDVEYYAEWCNQQADCEGFNSNGWMKSTIRPQ